VTVASSAVADRLALLTRFRRIRARTRALFDLLDPSMYYERPIPLRNPVVFYEGHLPAFAVNTLLKKALGRPGIDERFEEIFARGIDPATEAKAIARGNPAWPSRTAVREYGDAADRAIESAIESADLESSGPPMLHRGEALWTILEHEEMHQETLTYMWHAVPYEKKRRPGEYVTAPDNSRLPTPNSQLVTGGQIRVPAGVARLGTTDDEAPFAWDNEREAHELFVPAFTVDRHNVTNGQFMAFVEAGGYTDAQWWRPEDWEWVVATATAHPWFWTQESGRWYCRGMFGRVPLPSSWPVYVTWAEARAYASWRGARLLTEPEFQRAAEGSTAGNCDFERWDPEPVGARPDTISAFGVHDLVGNGWEWTSTVFAPFDGFSPLASYPEYSADFFDAEHFVMKGASPTTPRELVRPGFRNWFRPRYPYVYATFRCVGGEG
jgi:gamma-glutamyl hercynylcysteine S-oxide synthase